MLVQALKPGYTKPDSMLLLPHQRGLSTRYGMMLQRSSLGWLAQMLLAAAGAGIGLISELDLSCSLAAPGHLSQHAGACHRVAQDA